MIFDNIAKTAITTFAKLGLRLVSAFARWFWVGVAIVVAALALWVAL